MKPGESRISSINPTNGRNATMYTSYAKDIFCELWDAENTTTSIETMKHAIELVKQAKSAFE